MILNIFVDVDIEENEQIDIELIDLHSGIVKISGVGVKPCKLLEASQNKSMLISECGFSHELNKFLIDNDIWYCFIPMAHTSIFPGQTAKLIMIMHSDI